MIYKRGGHWHMDVTVHGHVRMATKRTALEKLESGLMGPSRMAAQPAAQKVN